METASVIRQYRFNGNFRNKKGKVSQLNLYYRPSVFDSVFQNMMDNSKKTAQRARKMIQRSWKLNEVAGERLKRDLIELDASCHRLGQNYDRKMESLQNELDEMSEKRRYLDSQLPPLTPKSPRLTSSLGRETTPDIRSTSRNDRRWRNLHSPLKSPMDSRGEVSFPSCRRDGCRLFPCRRPSTYHSFGPYQSVYQDWKGEQSEQLGYTSPYTNVATVKAQHSKRPAFKPPPETSRKFQPTCHYLGVPSQTTRLRAREEQIISGMQKRMRSKHLETWCTNYGRPVPFRRLLKPVVT